MKQFKYIAAIVLMIVSAAGCREKENPNIKLPINTELTFQSHAELYKVGVEEDAAWEVKSHPEWVTPMQGTGSAGDKIVLFVEDNFEEEERKGEMSVITDKHEIVYTITQNSSLSDDENAEIVSDEILSLTYGVGYGINVFGTPSMGKYKFAGAIVNPANLSRILANVGEADAYCAEDHYFSKTESISGTSTTSLATQLSVNAGIEVEVTGFSGSLNGKFTSNESSNTETAYAMREIKHVVGSRYLRPGILRSLSAENCDSIFAKSFYSLSQSIRKNPSNSDNYIKKLLDNYGTHLVVHGTLGGELELAMEMTSTEKISEMDINAALNLSSDVVNGDASFTMNETETALAKNTKISLKTYGGNNVYTLKPGTTFEEAMQEALSTSQLNNWIASIKDKSALALIDVQLYPIYDLMPDAASRDAVREYMINKYQKSKTKIGPLNFAVSGFGDDGVIAGEAYIPQIDVKLECYQEKVPEISNDEPSIIIYSGTQHEMNYDRGFFIGSKTLKPGKLRKNREGLYTFEEFEDLEPGQITELYVTADGDILIAGKPGVAYSDVKFTGMTKEFLSKNRAPSIVEATTDATRYHVGSPSLIASDGIKNWLYKYYDSLDFSVSCAIDLYDDDCVKEAINLGNINLVLEYSKPKEYKSKYIYPSFYNSEVRLINSYTLRIEDKDKVECEYSIPSEAKYIGIMTSCYGSDDMPKVFDEESIKVYFKFTYKNTPRWR